MTAPQLVDAPEASGYPIFVGRDEHGRVRMLIDLEGRLRLDPDLLTPLPATPNRAMDRLGVYCAVLGTHQHWNTASRTGWFISTHHGVYISPEGVQALNSRLRDRVGIVH